MHGFPARIVHEGFASQGECGYVDWTIARRVIARLLLKGDRSIFDARFFLKVNRYNVYPGNLAEISPNKLI
jgi:hypothetical protein